MYYGDGVFVLKFPTMTFNDHFLKFKIITDLVLWCLLQVYGSVSTISSGHILLLMEL